MRKPTIGLVFSFGLLLAMGGAFLLSCGEENTPIFTDEEKVAAAKAMVDKYVAAWNEMDIDRIISYYASYSTILVPTVGTLNADRYKDYLEQLFGPMAEVVYEASDREAYLVESETADVKFRAWLLMRTDGNEYYAAKTWITWRLHWTTGDKWTIASENGSDKVAVKDYLLGVLATWIAGWETKTIDDILSVYADDAAIVEPDGQEYNLTGYGELLGTNFGDIDAIDLEYLLFHVDEFSWEGATVSFQLLSTITRLDGSTAYRTDNITWQLEPADETWLVTRQETKTVSATDDDATDDDTTADDDTTVDDDTADDDTADDDTV